MIIKFYKILLMFQIVGTTMAGFLFYDLTGMIGGFIAGVLIAGHFLTTLSTREINVENKKILSGLFGEIKNIQQLLDKNISLLPVSKDKN